MQRRQFLNTAAAAASACALAGAGAAQAQEKQEIQYTCKITVAKRTLQKEFIDKHRGGRTPRCDIFQDGQEFIVKSPWEKPEGFCDWAWGDIRTFIHLVREGKFERFATCCTDGYRPVFFELERVPV